MKIPSLKFIIILFLLNILWILTLLSYNINSNFLYPKFISSSFDPEAKFEFDSLILKSISEYFSNFLPKLSIISKHVGDIPNGKNNNNNKKYNETLLKNYKNKLMLNKTNSKFEMFFDKENNLLKIIKIFNDFSNYNSIVSLFYIDLNNFLIDEKSEFNIDKSLIFNCWNMKIFGKILNFQISYDKKYLLILYSIKKNNIINYRFRYFKININNNFDDLIKIDNEKIKIKLNSYFENKFDLESKFNYNFYSNLTFDDFFLNGNSKIINFDVKKNFIIMSSENSNFVNFLYRKKNKWKEILFTNQLNLNNLTNYYSKIIYLKFINNTDFNLIFFQLSISLTNKGIFSYGNIFKINNSNTKNISLSFQNKIKYQIDKNNNNNNCFK